MTSDLILTALRTFIGYQSAIDGATELDALDVYIEGETYDLLPPFIDLRTTGSKEHEVLKGVIDFSIVARIATVPRATDGTTTDDSKELSQQLYDVLGNVTGLVDWSEFNNTTSIIFNATDYGMQTESDGDLRISTITFTLTGCKIN